MAEIKVTQLPTVTQAFPSDIIYAVQGGLSVQETLQQVFNAVLASTVLNSAGNPNGSVAGSVYQLCWDTVDGILYVCTTTGSASTAVWTPVSSSASSITNPAHGGTGVASPTAHTLPVAEGASNFNFLGPLTNGQLLMGSTGVDPVPNTITAGAGITVSNAPGAITITASGSGAFNWTHVTGSSQAMLPNNGYIADNPGLVTLPLPLVSALGDEIDVIDRGAGGFLIAQNASQVIRVGNVMSTAGVTGSVASTQLGDVITMICTVANLEWTAYSVIGNLTIV